MYSVYLWRIKIYVSFHFTDISDNIEECVLFRFPGNNNDILTLTFCILYDNYYIYIKKLSNSKKIDFLNFLTYLKRKINIEKICSTEGRNEAFESFSLLDHLWWSKYICSIYLCKQFIE